MISLLSNYWAKMNEKCASTHVRRHTFHWVHTVTKASGNVNCLWLSPQNLYRQSVIASVLTNVFNSLTEFPFWEGKQWEERNAVPKNAVTGRASSCKAGEPKGPGAWAELVWRLFPPTEICPQGILSLGWGEKVLDELVLWKQQGVLQERLLQDYLSFLLSQQGPVAPFPHGELEWTLEHMSCCCGGLARCAESEEIYSVFLRYSDARRCDIKSAEEMSPAQLTPEKGNIF